MGSRNLLLNNTIDLVTQDLSDLGFKKRQREILTCDLNEESIGWIGLNHGIGEGIVSINPVIGIRHQPLEKLVAEISGDKFHPYLPPTISTPLGSFLPKNQYPLWEFAEGCDNYKTEKDMIRKIKKCAIPFMRSHATFETMVPLLIEDRLAPSELQVMKRIPAAYYLAGQKKMANKVLKSELKEFAGENHPAAQEYRQYVKAFLKLLKRTA